MTRRLSRATLAWLTAASLLCSGAPALAAGDEDGPNAGSMTADLLVARPLGALATLGGAVVFVVSLPFSALGGNVQEAADQLVVKPAKATFVRCLGCKANGRYQSPGR